MTRKTFLSLGECMIELAEADAQCWRMGIAGDTLNTTWYARAFLDTAQWDVAYFTRVGQDRYSQRIIDFLKAADIGTEWVARDKHRQAGLYLIETTDGERSFTYWRGQSAARLLADDTTLLERALTACDIAYFSGITLAILSAERREIFLEALAAKRQAGGAVIFDPNLRPALWKDPDTMRSAITAAARVTDVALPSFEDEAALFGDATPHACAERYRESGCGEVVVKNGGSDMVISNGDHIETLQGLAQVTPVDTTGAGDSFNGAYLAARQQGAGALAAARFAHDVAAEVVTHRGALMDVAALDPLRGGWNGG